MKVKKEFCHFKGKCRENRLHGRVIRESEPVFRVQERNMIANVWDKKKGGLEMLPSL